MDFTLGAFNYVRDLGAATIMPIIICIVGLTLGAGFGKSIRAGLTVGIGFTGLNLVTGLMESSLGAAVQGMVSRFSLELSVIDVGWPSMAAIAFASTVGMVIIPVCLVVNMVILLTNTTQIVGVDIQDYWRSAFIGALVAMLTDNQIYGVIATILSMATVMVLGDQAAKSMEETLGLPGVSLPHGFTTAYAPIAVALNRIIDMIPRINKINFDLEKMQKKFGVFGEPILVGTVLGLVIGVLTGHEIAPTTASEAYAGDMGILGLSVNLDTTLVLTPKMAALLMEGPFPISDAASEFIEKKFSNRDKIYIGLDSVIGVGHPLTLSVAPILIPLAVFLAMMFPGGKVMPFADLAVFLWMFVLITPVVKGNGFRALVIGFATVTSGLCIATNLTPLITQATVLANYNMGTATAISSICDGTNPLIWLIVRLHGVSPIVGITSMDTTTLAMALVNREEIKKEAAALRSARQMYNIKEDDSGLYMYTYDSAIYTRKIMLIGILCITVLTYTRVRILAGGSLPMWTGAEIVTAHTIWETFISLSSPKQVRMGEHETIFSAYGEEHRYGWNEISQFRVKELMGTRKLFIRTNQTRFFRGRYWLHCYHFNDTDKPYNTIMDRECLTHPDSIKTWTRGKNKPVS